MQSKRLLFTGGAILIMLLGLSFFGMNHFKIIPLLNGVKYGMSPQRVEQKLTEPISIVHDVAGTGKVAYEYAVHTLGEDATVICYFLNNHDLVEVSICWSNYSDDLYDLIYEKLYQFYSDSKFFFEQHHFDSSGKHVRTSIGIDNGITGLHYTIFLDTESLIVQCVINS